MKAAGEVGDLDRYVFFEALAKQTRDPIELRVQVMNILLAGRDTTASLLGFTILRLARDAERYRKLREIVLEEFGTFNEPENITFMHIKNCKYLQWVLNETLRLYPLVPWNFRVANKDTTLPRGGGKDGKSKVFVKKGTVVEYSVFALHRRKELWGEDADEFKPERWEGRKGGWDYLPVCSLCRFSHYFLPPLPLSSTSEATLNFPGKLNTLSRLQHFLDRVRSSSILHKSHGFINLFKPSRP